MSKAEGTAAVIKSAEAHVVACATVVISDAIVLDVKDSKVAQPVEAVLSGTTIPLGYFYYHAIEPRPRWSTINYSKRAMSV